MMMENSTRGNNTLAISAVCQSKNSFVFNPLPQADLNFVVKFPTFRCLQTISAKHKKSNNN